MTDSERSYVTEGDVDRLWNSSNRVETIDIVNGIVKREEKPLLSVIRQLKVEWEHAIASDLYADYHDGKVAEVLATADSILEAHPNG